MYTEAFLNIIIIFNKKLTHETRGIRVLGYVCLASNEYSFYSARYIYNLRFYRQWNLSPVNRFIAGLSFFFSRQISLFVADKFDWPSWKLYELLCDRRQNVFSDKEYNEGNNNNDKVDA